MKIRIRFPALYILSTGNCISQVANVNYRIVMTELIGLTTRSETNAPATLFDVLEQPPDAREGRDACKKFFPVALALLFQDFFVPAQCTKGMVKVDEPGAKPRVFAREKFKFFGVCGNARGGGDYARNNPADYPDLASCWRPSDLALQYRLGLLSLQRPGSHRHYPPHPRSFGQDIGQGLKVGVRL
jgi:hypothetical protein